MADKGVESGEEEEPTIAEDVVVTKYKMAGDMANSKYKKYFFPRHIFVRKTYELNDLIVPVLRSSEITPNFAYFISYFYNDKMIK